MIGLEAEEGMFSTAGGEEEEEEVVLLVSGMAWRGCCVWVWVCTWVCK